MNADELQNLIQEKSVHVTALQNEFKNGIVGQRYLMQRLLISLLSDGHVLVEGLPGLAKTLAVKQCLRRFRQISNEFNLRPICFPPI